MVFVVGGDLSILANELMIITIGRKIPYRSPFHDKVYAEKLHPRVK
jgi:hypothetical protein